jgi:hypothetical protein
VNEPSKNYKPESSLEIEMEKKGGLTSQIIQTSRKSHHFCEEDARYTLS